MSDFRIAPAADSDLDEVWDYYALELQNPDAADRVIDEIFDAFERLARSPGIGHFRTDLATEPVRFWHVRSYLVVYRSENHSVEITRVLHGARDLRAILGGQSDHTKPTP